MTRIFHAEEGAGLFTAAANTSSQIVIGVARPFGAGVNLQRRVDPFRMFGAAHDLKLNGLLRLAFDEYEQRRRVPRP